MELEERAADPLAGGMMRGYQCGMVWGTALAAGAQVYRTLGAGPHAEAAAVAAAQRTTEAFRAQNKQINCREITGIDLTAPTTGAVVRFLIKSAPRGSCLGMAARCAKSEFREINAALSQRPAEVTLAPVSCSALLAQKMGTSDMHTVMAAGLAGGIGLSGGACGALGAAIWIQGMRVLEQGGQIVYKAPYAARLIECFTKHAHGQFECFKITGRRFESLAEHAAYLRAGGCAGIIEALAA
jgi:hypothetical protein